MSSAVPGATDATEKGTPSLTRNNPIASGVLITAMETVEVHQHVDDDLELPIPDWIQRTAHELDKAVADGRTSLKKVNRALRFLGMIEVDDFCCPILEVNSVTGRITFIWPATSGAILVGILENFGRCVINYEKNFGVHTRKVGGPPLLRQELIKLYPFLKWRWDRNTLQ